MSSHSDPGKHTRRARLAKTASWVAAVGLAMGAIPLPAQALGVTGVTLADPIYTIYEDGVYETVAGPGIYNFGPGSGTATLSGSPAKAESAVDLAPGVFELGVGAVTTYQFEVTGPVNTTVPLVITASAFTTATGPFSAAAAGFGILDDASNVIAVKYACAGISAECQAIVGSGLQYFGNGAANTVPPASGSTFTGSLDFSAQSDQAYTVGVFGGAESVLFGSAFGGADPLITIDPNFGDASQFSLQFSPGIENGVVSPVPLPSALGMFASILGPLCLAARRARKRTAR